MTPSTDRHFVRQFLDRTEWATVPTIALLLFGSKRKEYVRIANSVMTAMSRTKRTDALKRLPFPHTVIYAHPRTKKKRLGTALFDHDNKIRECIARWLFDHGAGEVERLHFHPPADATIGNVFFELDNGHMTDRQLREKIERHYAGPGRFQVVFFMASPNKAHWRTRERIEADELRRLAKILTIAREVLPHKPHRILAASYEQFLEEGKLYSFKRKRP
jgi:hypothetical protein